MIIGTRDIIVTLFWPKAKYMVAEINLLLARYPEWTETKFATFPTLPK